MAGEQGWGCSEVSGVGMGGDCRSLVGGKEERWQMKPPVSANWRHYRKCGAILLLFSVSLTFLLR